MFQITGKHLMSLFFAFNRFFVLVLFCNMINKEFYHTKILVMVENTEKEKERMGIKPSYSLLVTQLI